MMFRNCFIVYLFLQVFSIHSQNLNDKEIKVIPSLTFEKIILKNIPAKQCEFKIVDSKGVEVKNVRLLKPNNNTEFVISIEDLDLGAYSYIITCENKLTNGKFVKDWFDADLL